MAVNREELAQQIEDLNAKASTGWQVHRCPDAARHHASVACGICSNTGKHPCPADHGMYANVIGDNSHDECHHPASLVDMELAVLLRNHADVIVEALRRAESADEYAADKRWRG